MIADKRRIVVKVRRMTQYKPVGWPFPSYRGYAHERLHRRRDRPKTSSGTPSEVRSRAPPAEIRIEVQIILISDGGGIRETMPSFLYVLCLVPTEPTAPARSRQGN